MLLAEDDAANRLLLSELLDQFGCRVTAVADGAAAVEAARSQRFDLAILDFHMPQLDGTQVARSIRAWEQTMGTQRLPIVACTASAMPQEKRACLDAGMDAVLTKPFLLREVRELIARWTRYT